MVQYCEWMSDVGFLSQDGFVDLFSISLLSISLHFCRITKNLLVGRSRNQSHQNFFRILAGKAVLNVISQTLGWLTFCPLIAWVMFFSTWKTRQKTEFVYKIYELRLRFCGVKALFSGQKQVFQKRSIFEVVKLRLLTDLWETQQTKHCIITVSVFSYVV